jgi:hypothetical protein
MVPLSNPVSQRDLGSMLISACNSGHLDVLKYVVHEMGGSVNGQLIFYACLNMHLHIAQWLLDNGIEFNRVELFVDVCENGTLAAAKWVLSLGVPIDHNIVLDAFECACCYGSIDVARWLYYEIGGISNDNVHSIITRSSSSDDFSGSNHVFKWLLEVLFPTLIEQHRMDPLVSWLLANNDAMIVYNYFNHIVHLNNVGDVGVVVDDI